ncbi:MAG TPA: hypothetical protein VEC01_14510 [Noviherbaspirillum sp.]|uniref:hypothetical protein n=1 Tax=Noviherbaspirillum sp. TaxID=1926288 RepID=UPI002D6452DD|nr:hypothetical protein [Noviherbaspirillum sp.]HYD96538.1 hypothetical protein [Noviherbaspirillum sp.]
MDSTPNYELLKDAYAIIDGIPETAIDLDALCSARGETLEQGTICSPAGWLAQHPQFMALGLALAEDGTQLTVDGEPAADPSEALSRVLGLRTEDAQHLFGDRNTYTLGDDTGLSDKRLWQREVREFLKQHGQLDEEFEEHLETRGPFADPANPAQIRAI